MSSDEHAHAGSKPIPVVAPAEEATDSGADSDGGPHWKWRPLGRIRRHNAGLIWRRQRLAGGFPGPGRCSNDVKTRRFDPRVIGVLTTLVTIRLAAHAAMAAA
jgi:hypothetical protein